MKKWLTYLLPMMVVALFWICKDNHTYATPDEDAPVHSICETVCDNVIYASESELCPARQISYAGPSRTHTSARRTAGYARVNVEFAKSGKLINSGLRYFIQTKSILLHSTLIEPAYKLLYLGKLII